MDQLIDDLVEVTGKDRVQWLLLGLKECEKVVQKTVFWPISRDFHSELNFGGAIDSV